MLVNPVRAKADGYYSDGDGLSMILNIAAAVLMDDGRQRHVNDRREYDHNLSRSHNHSYNRNPNGYNYRAYNRIHNARPERRGAFSRQNSFTSQPIRGGDSKRTRIIDNPYPDRRVVGITLTGIDNEVVHVEDVVSYPARRTISHRGYSLSLFHPERHINTRGHIDYISVKAKRREYFTVTFHYG